MVFDVGKGIDAAVNLVIPFAEFSLDNQDTVASGTARRLYGERFTSFEQLVQTALFILRIQQSVQFRNLQARPQRQLFRQNFIVHQWKKGTLIQRQNIIRIAFIQGDNPALLQAPVTLQQIHYLPSAKALKRNKSINLYPV